MQCNKYRDYIRNKSAYFHKHGSACGPDCTRETIKQEVNSLNHFNSQFREKLFCDKAPSEGQTHKLLPPLRSSVHLCPGDERSLNLGLSQQEPCWSEFTELKGCKGFCCHPAQERVSLHLPCSSLSSMLITSKLLNYSLLRKYIFIS